MSSRSVKSTNPSPAAPSFPFHASTYRQAISQEVEADLGAAFGAALRRAARRAAKRLRARDARARGRRSGTVCGRWSGTARVPDLRMSGLWLREAGFDLGQCYEVEVQAGSLVVRAV